ncbi:MAG: hypothetical protein JWL59_774 [Chthoniobacteraceae bacterium]|nr:hypothetical protein [Chthoniobacteraceae bacterium]
MPHDLAPATGDSIFTMNASLPCTLLALAALSLSSGAQQTAVERAKEKAVDTIEATKETTKQAADAVARTSREAWGKTKAYLSDDPDTYRRGAEQKLNTLGAEISNLRSQSAGIKDRTYFLTRIESLEQHHKYAAEQLVALPQEELRKGREGLRKRVDLILERLDAYVDLAQNELKDFTRLP